MIALFRVVGSAVLLIGSVATANAAGGPPKLLGDASRGVLTWQVRPAHIVYTGDGSGVLGGFDGTGARHPGHLTWLSWTPTQARGSGAVWIDNCTPDCASGKFTSHTVKVIAFRPLNGHFTRLTLTYTYNSKRYVDKRGIIFNAGSWMYYIVGYAP